MVEFGTSSTFSGWVRVRVLGYGSGARGRKVKSRDCGDCALASDLVKAGPGPDNVWQLSNSFTYPLTSIVVFDRNSDLLNLKLPLSWYYCA